MRWLMVILLWGLSEGTLMCQGDIPGDTGSAFSGDPSEITGTIVENLISFHEDAAEGAQTALHDWVETLVENPVNINTGSEDALAQSSLFTPFQVYGILKNREKYGPFFSIYELAAIPGFRKDWLMSMAPLITCENSPSQPLPTSTLRIFSLSNVSVRFPLSEAYRQNAMKDRIYIGSPVKIIHRVKLEFGSNWSAGLVYEKDPGESLFHSGNPEHLAGYVSYHSPERIKEVILGNFRLHTGAGLVHGLGFQSRSAGPVINGYRMAYVKPFASASEYSYMRGYCLNLNLGKWDILFYGSHRPEDFSFNQFGKKGSLYEHIRKTGLHRTVGERSGANLAYHLSSGVSLNRLGKRWNAGLLAAASRLALRKQGRDSIGAAGPASAYSGNLSLNGVVFGPWYQLFGELAVNHSGRPALLVLSEVELNPALQVSLSFRRYGEGYTGQYPRCFGGGEDPENVAGLNLGIDLSPFPNIRARLSVDIQRPLQTLSGSPKGKAGNCYEIYQVARITWLGEENNQWGFQLVRQQEPAVLSEWVGQNSSSPIQQKIQVHGQYRLGISDGWEISGRLAGTFSPGSEKSSPGSSPGKPPGQLFYQQISGKPLKALRITYRYTLFHIDAWDQRIYAYEPGVRYSFSFPAFHGNGSRNVLVLSWRINRWFTLRAKGGCTRYAHTLSTGSGNDTRPGSRIFDGELQLQVKLRT